MENVRYRVTVGLEYDAIHRTERAAIRAYRRELRRAGLRVCDVPAGVVMIVRDGEYESQTPVYPERGETRAS